MPKNFGAITDPMDIPTKQYVDNAVIANPTVVGTEANLTALQVGGTKYKVPSGGSGVSFLTVVDGKVCIVYDDGVSA